MQLTPASNSAFTSRKPKISNVEDEPNIRLISVWGDNPEEAIGDTAYNAAENNGIRRSKRIPKANRTEKYGAIMLGL